MNTYNIPTVTVEHLIEQLTALYSTAYKQDMLSEIPSVALWGSMGVGKSTAVKQIAKQLSQAIGKQISVTDIRLLNFTPVDLRGIPAADSKKEFAVWLKPKIFDLPEDEVSILFLDEISAAPQSLQAAAYQIALDKQIGEHTLPKNCIVICAGNRTTDRSVAFRMPKALANRLVHFEVEADCRGWCEWAWKQGLDARVIGYLSFQNSKLNVEAEFEELAFPTPRSWEFVSRLLKTTGKEPAQLHDLISGCIGVSHADEFEMWCDIYDKLPSMEDIFSGKQTEKVRGIDVMYAVISSLVTAIRQRSKTITTAELNCACQYIAKFPADFAAMFFENIIKIEEIKTKIANVSILINWAKRNKHII